MLERDTLMLKVGGYEYDEFSQASLTSDLYDPVGSFSLTLGYQPKAKAGDRCEVYVNGLLEMTGIIDRVECSWDKKSHGYTVSGRSLVGLLADSYLTSFKLPPKTLKAMVAKYIADIPYLKESRVEYHADCSISRDYHGLDVGATAFSVFTEYAISRGLIFWAKPDGTLVFGKAKESGLPLYIVDAAVAKSGRRVEDISKLYSQVMVVSDHDAGFKTAVETNPHVPFRKIFVAAYNADGGSIAKQARTLMHQQKLAAYQLDYTVPGFSQSGKNWRVNELAKVDDSQGGAAGTFLIHRRTFERSIQSGSTSKLSLGLKVIEEPFKALPKGAK